MTASHLDVESIELHAQGRGAAAEHLAECAACREAVARARARQRLLSGLEAPELHEAVFARVERRLFEEKPKRSWAWWGVPAFGLALTAALVAVVSLRPKPVALPVAPLRAQKAPAPAEPPVAAAVTFLEGVAEREDLGRWSALDPAAAIWEGAHLRTGDGRLGLQVSKGRGATLSTHGDLRLGNLTRSNVRFDLSAGRLASAVAPLSPQESFLVKAGPWYVHVVGTAFAVTRGEGSLLVEVDHGTVAVSDALDGPVVRVPGPGRLEAKDGAPVASLTATPLSESDASALHARGDWRWAQGQRDGAIRLDIGDLPLGATVELEDGDWGPAPVSAWLAPGTYKIRARVAGEAERIGTVSLAPGLTVARFTPPAAKVAAKKPRAPAVPPAVVRALLGVEREHHRELTYCYEHALKRNPTVAGRVMLGLTLTPEGAVDEATATAGDGSALPDELSECILEGVRQWNFPAGSPSTFELPLELQAH